MTVELGGFARVSAAIEAAWRQATPNDAQAARGRRPHRRLYLTQSEGQADAALMNTVCFDAFTLGNHEFDSADAGLVKFIDYLHAGACKTPVLSDNVKPAAGRRWRRGLPTTASSARRPAGRRGRSDGRDKTCFAPRPDAGTSFLDEATAAQAAIDALRPRVDSDRADVPTSATPPTEPSRRSSTAST